MIFVLLNINQLGGLLRLFRLILGPRETNFLSGPNKEELNLHLIYLFPIQV
jgi:hypothetical protein